MVTHSVHPNHPMIKQLHFILIFGGDLVNGFYLPALNADTFNLDEQMNVTGTNTFLEEVVVKGNVYLVGLNGSYFEVPVNLFDNYHISGFWIFDGETTFTNNLYITG